VFPVADALAQIGSKCPKSCSVTECSAPSPPTRPRKSFRKPGCPGLVCAFRTKGARPFFSYRTPDEGVRIRRTLGLFPKMSLADARKLVRSDQVQLDQGIDPHGEEAVSEVAEPLTFGGLARIYLDQHRGRDSGANRSA